MSASSSSASASPAAPSALSSSSTSGAQGTPLSNEVVDKFIDELSNALTDEQISIVDKRTKVQELIHGVGKCVLDESSEVLGLNELRALVNLFHLTDVRTSGPHCGKNMKAALQKTLFEPTSMLAPILAASSTSQSLPSSARGQEQIVIDGANNNNQNSNNTNPPNNQHSSSSSSITIPWASLTPQQLDYLFTTFIRQLCPNAPSNNAATGSSTSAAIVAASCNQTRLDIRKAAEGYVNACNLALEKKTNTESDVFKVNKNNRSGAYKRWSERVSNKRPYLCNMNYFYLSRSELIARVKSTIDMNKEFPTSNAQAILEEEIANVLDINLEALFGWLMECLVEDDPVRITVNAGLEAKTYHRNEVQRLWNDILEEYCAGKGSNTSRLNSEWLDIKDGRLKNTNISMTQHIANIEELCTRMAQAKISRTASDKLDALVNSVTKWQGVRSHYVTIMCSTLVNNPMSTYEDIVSVLKKAEDLMLTASAKSENARERVNYTKSKFRGQHNNDHRNGDRNHGGNEKNQRFTSKKKNGPSQDSKVVVCETCQRPGHTKAQHYDCPHCKRAHSKQFICKQHPAKRRRSESGESDPTVMNGASGNDNSNNQRMQQQDDDKDDDVLGTLDNQSVKNEKSDNRYQKRRRMHVIAHVYKSSTADKDDVFDGIIQDDRCFIADCAATRHVLKSQQLARRIKPVREYSFVGHDNETTVTVTKEASVKINENMELNKFAIVSGGVNIISLSVLHAMGCRWNTTNNGLVVTFNGKTIIYFKLVNGLYIYTMPYSWYNMQVEEKKKEESAAEEQDERENEMNSDTESVSNGASGSSVRGGHKRHFSARVTVDVDNDEKEMGNTAKRRRVTDVAVASSESEPCNDESDSNSSEPIMITKRKLVVKRKANRTLNSNDDHLIQARAIIKDGMNLAKMNNVILNVNKFSPAINETDGETTRESTPGETSRSKSETQRAARATAGGDTNSKRSSSTATPMSGVE
jgi:hypothetical protein